MIETTMSPIELEEAQRLIENEIWRIPALKNLTSEAIADGVGDPAAYLSSKPRVAWVLKEPYDETCNGFAFGGGWSIHKDCFMASDGPWPVSTWQRVIYVMFGFKHNLHYNEMEYVDNDWDMGKVLREVAWINLSKMPFLTASDNLKVKESYQSIWKPIVRKQLDLFVPQVIVFGNTFDLCRDEFIDDWEEPVERVECDGKCFIEVFRQRDRILLSAYHPGLRYVRGVRNSICFYVDSLIDTIRKYSCVV